MSKEGWFKKYAIQKTDGSNVDPEADYFVLRLDKGDQAALAALEAYADTTTNEQLKSDLLDRLKIYINNSPSPRNELYNRHRKDVQLCQNKK